MIKAILFDLDNTLIDFLAMKKKCCSAAVSAMRNAGLKIEKKKAMKILFSLYGKHGMEYRKIFQKFLLETKGYVDYRILAHGINAYRKIREHSVVPYKNTRKTLEKLKKRYKLAIVSDAPRIEAWLRLCAMGIENFFDFVVTAADVRKKKTHSAPFNAALRALKVKPHEALMVGDRIERDIKPAKALGIKTCYARYGAWQETKKSFADFEIENIKDLEKAVKVFCE